MKEPKILFWDIESTGLNATFGTLLCIGYKFLGKKKVHIPTIIETSKKGMLNDHGLVKEFSKIYNEADYVVTWYGAKFDLPMVESKLIKYGEPPLPKKPHLDLWRTAWKYFKLHSNRLAAWSEYLEVDHRKTAIKYDDWLQAAHGSKKHLMRVKEHCRLDVLVLEEVFERMRPWLESEPSRHLFTGEQGVCECGSHNLQRRGYYASKTRAYQRWQCQDCGKWQKTRLSDPDHRPTLIGL